MKNLKILLLFIVIFLVGCDQTEPPIEKDFFEGIKSTYEIKVNETIDFKKELGQTNDNYTIESSTDLVEVDGLVVKAVKDGNVIIKINVFDKSKDVSILIHPLPNFDVEDVVLYQGETKDLVITNVIGNVNELEYINKSTGFELIDGKIKGLKVGDFSLTIKLNETVKDITISVLQPEIHVLNTTLEVDILDTLELNIEYPEFLGNNLTYKINKEDIISINDNIITPLKEGKTRVKISVGEETVITKNIEIEVVIDPIKIIKMMHNEEALMLKDVTSYGNSVLKNVVMGSVSRYMFDDLNLVNKIIPINDNPYVGLKATKEILTTLDRKQLPSNAGVNGYPRTGVKLEEIKYLTYHDTGNNSVGANALSNANWMSNSYSISTTARSWHYTVDSNQVIQSLPDDEVGWQGDAYEAYATSIGIETCVDSGSNFDKTWHRMGKLCAQLINRYGLTIDSIKQHYDWNKKECPQTLRKNGLYPYALSLVEAELLALKYLKSFTLKFESLSPEYLDNTGQIIKAPTEPITVSYKVTITNKAGYNDFVILDTIVNPLKLKY